MMGEGSGRLWHPFWLVAGFLAAASITLLACMIVVTGPQFEALVHLQIPDFRLTGYERADVDAVMVALNGSPEAARLLRFLHLVPDMLLPAFYAGLCLMLLVRFSPGATVFHKPLSGFRWYLVLAVPVAYALFDYAENAVSLLLFPPATPTGDMARLLAGILPFLTRTKAMLFFIALILVLRFSLFREQSPDRAAPDSQA
nr:hypothetical protein [uncultured Gellertiella sp.]